MHYSKERKTRKKKERKTRKRKKKERIKEKEKKARKKEASERKNDRKTERNIQFETAEHKSASRISWQVLFVEILLFDMRTITHSTLAIILSGDWLLTIMVMVVKITM